MDSIGKKKIYFKNPKKVTKYSSKNQLSRALGAALYIPASQFVSLVYGSEHWKRANSLVLDLEDSIAEREEKESMVAVLNLLDRYESWSKQEHLPLLLIRISNIEQLSYFIQELNGKKTPLLGFVFPKFEAYEHAKYFEVLHRYDTEGEPPLYALPVLETSTYLRPSNDEDVWHHLKECLTCYQPHLLGVRIGLTDFSNVFGIRKTLEQTAYDLSFYQIFITKVMYYLLRDEAIHCSGPVFEYFDTMEAQSWKEAYQKELELDRSHGLLGKTVIHPSQISYVQASLTVLYSDYEDACRIMEQQNEGGGVFRGREGRMNEVNPHFNWAVKQIQLAEVYGVLNTNITRKDLVKYLENAID